MLGKFICFWLFAAFVALFVLKVRTMIKMFKNRSTMSGERYFLKIWLGSGLLVLIDALAVFFAFGMFYGPGYWIKSWIFSKLIPTNLLSGKLLPAKLLPGKVIPKLPFGN